MAMTDEQYEKAMAAINIELEQLEFTVDQYAIHNIHDDVAWAAAIESHQRIKELADTVTRNIDTLRKDDL
jgi:hypothetical protein